MPSPRSASRPAPEALARFLYHLGSGIPSANLPAPTLILIGDKDDWTPADRCRDMVARARSDGAPITLHVYPGAITPS